MLFDQVRGDTAEDTADGNEAERRQANGEATAKADDSPDDSRRRDCQPLVNPYTPLGIAEQSEPMVHEPAESDDDECREPASHDAVGHPHLGPNPENKGTNNHGTDKH